MAGTEPEVSGQNQSTVATARVRGPLLGAAAECEPILQGLPSWFGVDSAVQEYGRRIGELPTFVADLEGQVAGFVTIKQQNSHAAEIYVMGVRCDLHRRGVGKTLLTAAEEWMRSVGIEYAYVKTLGPSLNYEPYERTRLFYACAGYRPLEEFKRLWGNDPCLIMVKKL